MDTFLADYQDRISELHKDILNAIEGLPQEALDWIPGEDIPSINVLVTHLTGAERYWIGDVAGGVPSDRNRDEEFSTSGLDLAALKERLLEIDAFEKNLFAKINLVDMESICISPRTGRRFTVGWALMHALEHTAIHLGHIQIVRQMWDQQTSG